MLFLGHEMCHSSETTTPKSSMELVFLFDGNSTGNSSKDLVFLFDGKHCRLYPKEMKTNKSLSECEFNVEKYKYWTEGFLLMIVSCVGILGNFASFIKFARQRTQKLFHYLLLGLAAFDMVGL